MFQSVNKVTHLKVIFYNMSPNLVLVLVAYSLLGGLVYPSYVSYCSLIHDVLVIFIGDLPFLKWKWRRSGLRVGTEGWKERREGKLRPG